MSYFRRRVFRGTVLPMKRAYENLIIAVIVLGWVAASAGPVIGWYFLDRSGR